MVLDLLEMCVRTQGASELLWLFGFCVLHLPEKTIPFLIVVVYFIYNDCVLVF